MKGSSGLPQIQTVRIRERGGINVALWGMIFCAMQAVQQLI
jgi:hypothetical protein